MIISIIAAVSENNVIGNANNIPWHLSDDLKRFKKLTTGHHIIMGRNTFESIGKALPNRQNIVLSRNENLQIEGCSVTSSIEQALEIAKNANETESFIIGGGYIYEKCISLADKICLTRVFGQYEGDVFFPEFDKSAWSATENTEWQNDSKSNIRYSYLTLEKS